MLVAFRPTSVLVDSSATKRGAYRPGPVKRLKHFFVCSAILIVIAFFVLFVNDKRFAKRMAPILVSPADGGILARGKMATTVTAEEEIEELKASEEEENVQDRVTALVSQLSNSDWRLGPGLGLDTAV